MDSPAQGFTGGFQSNTSDEAGQPRRIRMNHARVVALGLLAFVAAPAVQSATKATSMEKYPSRPIRFVVPFAPGGPSDILSRFVGQKLGEAVGETVVVDNR